MTGSSNNEMGQKVTSGVRGDGKKHTVHWFRKGLRLHDNPSLREGLAGASTFRCVFVLDPWFAVSFSWQGQTGFPWIDAIMTQLREEGWIHHLARHAVACFLTRGDLWISWEEGMKVFDELLLDADWSVNAGMWMWLSCSSFFQQFFHCYCPVRFGRKADPNGDYIRRYLPVLKNFPTRYIHEPWNAPLSIQHAAKCIIGKEYSLPMVNHSKSSRINIERMKQVYQQLNKYRGNGASFKGENIGLLTALLAPSAKANEERRKEDSPNREKELKRETISSPQ